MMAWAYHAVADVAAWAGENWILMLVVLAAAGAFVAILPEGPK